MMKKMFHQSIGCIGCGSSCISSGSSTEEADFPVPAAGEFPLRMT